MEELFACTLFDRLVFDPGMYQAACIGQMLMYTYAHVSALPEAQVEAASCQMCWQRMTNSGTLITFGRMSD